MSHNRSEKRRGVAILVHNTISLKEHKDLDILNKNSFECIFLEINRKNKGSLIVGSIYQPPNTNPKGFNNQYQLMIDRLKKEKYKELILGMDHNLDLLKTSTHTEMQHFLDINLNNNIYPCITRPTRITRTTATLIDNVFVSQQLHQSFNSCVIISNISGHMPSLVNTHGQGNNNKEPLEFHCWSLGKNKIQAINNMLLTTNWSTLNKSDVNIAFNELQEK